MISLPKQHPAPKQPRKTKAANIANTANEPALPPQTELAAWFRRMAEQADKGIVTAAGAVVTLKDAPAPITLIVDSTVPAERMALTGTLSQLQFMLNQTEHNQRMNALANKPAA